jgi:hypothetical protein
LCPEVPRETLAARVGEDRFFHFGLCRQSANAPLGWVLSSGTRRNMDEQLAGERLRALGE